MLCCRHEQAADEACIVVVAQGYEPCLKSSPVPHWSLLWHSFSSVTVHRDRAQLHIHTSRRVPSFLCRLVHCRLFVIRSALGRARYAYTTVKRVVPIPIACICYIRPYRIFVPKYGSWNGP